MTLLDTIIEEIKAGMSAKGVNQFAEEVGVSRDWFYRVINGQIKDPSLLKVEAILHATGKALTIRA